MRSVGTVRSARVPTPEIEARLGSEFGRLVNISAMGALVRIRAPFLVGRQCPLILNIPDAPVTLIGRIVRVEPTAPAEQAGQAPQVKFLVGVMFTEFSSSAKQAIGKLCGDAFSRRE